MTPTPVPAAVSRRELWVNESDGVNLRSEAKKSAITIKVLKFGLHLIALEGVSGPDTEGLTWQQVQTDEGQSGWIVSMYLSPTQPSSSTPTPTRSP